MLRSPVKDYNWQLMSEGHAGMACLARFVHAILQGVSHVRQADGTRMEECVCGQARVRGTCIESTHCKKKPDK